MEEKHRRPVLPIFRSQAQARILARVFLKEDGPSLSRVRDDTGVPLPTVHREIDRLEAAGLVVSERVGNVRLIRANADSPYHSELRSLLLKALGPVAVLAEALADVGSVKAAYVFGSWARRYLGEPGPAPADIDVAVIGDPDPNDVYTACRSAEDRLGIEVTPTVLSEAEWQSADTGFLRAVREGLLVPITEPSP